MSATTRFSIMVITISMTSVLFWFHLTFPCVLVLGFPIDFPFSAIAEISKHSTSLNHDISQNVTNEDQETLEGSDNIIYKESEQDKNLKSSSQLCADPGTIYYATIEPDFEGKRVSKKDPQRFRSHEYRVLRIRFI